MPGNLHSEFQRVFSVLPDDLVQAASDEALRRLKSEQHEVNPTLKWADFTRSGRFLRGGSTTLSDYLTRFVSEPSSDLVLGEMASVVADGGAEAGRVLYQRDTNTFFWFLPVHDAPAHSGSTPFVRGFRINQETFDSVVMHFNSGRGLTASERRVAFQLLGGLSLREASELDDVGIETKRAHIKSASAKMQCNGQLDLVRILLGQMVHVLNLSNDVSQQAKVIEGFLADHIKQGASLLVQSRDNGEKIYVIEIGPETGIPVLVCHGMMFGMLISGALEDLCTHGIRLVIPVRRGYLDARPVLGLRAKTHHVEASLKDLEFLMRNLPSGQRFLLGQSFGGALSLEFASRFPDLVDKLILVSTNLAHANPDKEGIASNLYNAYRRLIETESLARSVTLEFSAHYPDENRSRWILQRMFSASASDLDVLEGKGNASPVYGWFSELYQTSVSGIAEDYSFALQRLRLPAQSKAKLLILHGSEDPLTDLEDVREVVSDRPDALVLPVEGAGHFLSASHSDSLWKHVRQHVQ